MFSSDVLIDLLFSKWPGLSSGIVMAIFITPRRNVMFTLAVKSTVLTCIVPVWENLFYM